MTDVFDQDDVRALVELALKEDLGAEGDVTARILPETATAHGDVVARVDGTIAGLPLAAAVLARVEPRARWDARVRDGTRVKKQDVLARVEGPARGVLAAERTLLNFLQRLSGIATATRRFADAVAGTGAKVYDTRKTPPGWRTLAKYAVRMGGGANHRIGLFDQVLVKDNHLAIFGGEQGIPRAVAESRRVAPKGTRIEIEVTTQDGALSAARAGADIVLLDNFAPDALAQAVRAVKDDARARGKPAPELEASGGINIDNVRAYAQTGVDRVSVGWITHSAPALDLALDLDIERGRT